MNLKPPRVTIKFGRAAAIAKQVLREDQAMRRAARQMPRPVPWEWAKPRILPLLAGPYLDSSEAPLVRAVADPGCAIIFGLEVGRAFPLVDQIVAQRWECSAEQIYEVGMANLRRRAAALGTGSIRSGTLSGWIVAETQGVAWASSLVLLPIELMRLFGSQDQLLITPSRSTLMSFPLNAPTHIVADVAIEIESGAAFPLMLDPFALDGGKLVWHGALEDEPLESDD